MNPPPENNNNPGASIPPALDGATTALQRRVEELTAELESSQWVAAEQIKTQRESIVTLQSDLATERAARELAEAGLLSEQEGKAVLIQDLQQAERERDAALARAEQNLQDAKELDEKYLAEWRARVAAESALASARSIATEYAMATTVQCVKLQTDLALKTFHELVEALRPADGWSRKDIAPSPAPERSDKRSRWNELGELPVTVMATSEYPSPAPCSGCEELKKERHEYVVKLDALREEINETRANWDACHRQHEQCMKLLGRIQALLLDPNAQRTEWKIRNVQDLLREMLSKGELPEGWDE